MPARPLRNGATGRDPPPESPETEGRKMEYDFDSLPERDRYRLLVSFVAPRPIALVSTTDGHGVHNAAPMSFFNVFSHDPPIVILGIQTRPDGQVKDTVVNIRRSGEFVVHMVDMGIARQMILTGMDLPNEVDEIEFARMTAAPSVKVSPPRIRESPCAMECRVSRIIDYERRAIILGEVVQMYVRDDCLDENKHYVRPAVYQPIARMHADNYISSDRQFELLEPDMASPPDDPVPILSAARS
jgi:flavin reductase (DIM6/NTAB) family NADH-FMN oxidoreductase RutF